jgi:hypothetical protein
VAPFDGPFLSTVRRRLSIEMPGEVGYREGAPRAATLAVDGQPLQAGRVVRVAVARLFDPSGPLPKLWSVNLILRDGVVRVAKLEDEATSCKLAEAIAGALGVGYDPGELPEVCLLPGWPYGWKGQVQGTALVVSITAAFVASLFALHASPRVGWPACVAAALALDVGLNDLVLGPAMRRLAVEEARVKFGVGSEP